MGREIHLGLIMADKTKPSKNTSKRIFAAAFLFVFFFILYFSISSQLADTGVFEEFDILFEMDTPRVIEDMVVFREDHSRTRVHPLFVLMVNPAGTLLARLVGDEMLAARVINSALGALGVVLAFYFFVRYGRKNSDAAILAALFGTTTSQFFISAIPDTISLAVVSLVLTYSLFFISLKEKKVNFFPWFLVGLFTLGVTTTNFVQTGILFFIATFQSTEDKKLMRSVLRSAIYALAVLAFAVVLSLIQKVIYPTTALFFLPQSFAGELDYASPLIFRQPRVVIVHLIKTFLLINIAAPTPRFFTIHGLSHPGVTFAASHDYSPVGWAAVALWVGLMLLSAMKIIKEKKYLVFFLGLAACLAFNFILHSFYGVTETRIELFLYTGNLTFLVMTPLSEVIIPQEVKLSSAALVLLALLMVLNNFQVLRVIIQAMSFYKY